MTILIKKNESTTTLRRITVIIVDQSDGNTLETGQTNFNIEVSKAGGTQASGTGVWGEVGEGEYYYQFGTTEVNTFGKLTARFQKTGMREFKGEAQVVGFNPYQTIPTQSEVNAIPTQTEINVSVWGAVPANIAVQTDINALNDPTSSEINAVITTAHGAGSYSGTSSTVINSIVNAQGLEIQSLINALNDVSTNDVQSIINNLNDLSTSEVQSIVNAEGLEVQSLINALNDLSATQVQSIVNAQGLEVQSLINALNDVSTNQIQSIINTLNDPTSSAINAVITTAHGAGSYVGAGASQTIINEHNATQSMINALNNITSSAVNAVITTAHGAGSYVGSGASQTIINEHNATQSMINALNNVTSSAVNAVITTAHGAGSYVGSGASQTIINEHNATQSLINALHDLSSSQVQSIVNAEGNEVQSLINALNDISVSEVQSIVNAGGGTTPSSIWNFGTRKITAMTQTDINEHNATQSLINALNNISTSEVQSIVNAQGLETQSLINALNDLSTSEVQSIVNAQGLEVQSLINAMDVKIIRIEGRGGRYLVGKYTYNTSDINTKIEYWQYASQTDMNNHQTINNINKWQLDATLAGQLSSVIKVGDHA